MNKLGSSRFSLRHFFLLTAIIIGVALPGLASTLDQEQANAQFDYQIGSSQFFKQIAQSFTAGTTGQLAGIELRLGLLKGSSTTGSVTVELRNTMAGAASYGTGYTYTQIPGTTDISPASGTLLASTSLSAASLTQVDPSLGQTAAFTNLITFGTPVSMTDGSMYSILLRTTGDSSFVWSFDYTGSYSAGEGFARLGDGYAWSYIGFAGNPPSLGDFAFRTYVDGPSASPVPEPASLALLGSGLAGLAGFRKRFL